MQFLNSPLFLSLGAILLIVLLAVIVWRLRGERDLTKIPPPPPPPAKIEELFNEIPKTSEIFAAQPHFDDMALDMTRSDTFSTQLQTAMHNIRIEAVGNRMHYVADGVTYQSLDDIPDAELEKLARQLYEKAFKAGPLGPAMNETLRQVILGNQNTIEARSSEYTLSIQNDGKQTRYIVNGLTYYNPKEVPDPDLHRRIQQLQKRML